MIALAKIDPEAMNAPPIHGNYCYGAGVHLARAHALALSLLGEGFDAFHTASESIQHDLLALVADEIGRAAKAMEAERLVREARTKEARP